MKKIILGLLYLCLTANLAQAQSSIPDSPAGKMLNKWLVAHNTGAVQALRQFVQTSHTQAFVQNKKKVAAHTRFYNVVRKDFGNLETTPYKFIVNQPHKLEVYLLKNNIANQWQQVKPENILVVKIDIDPKNPQHLARGIGLGSLICYQKKGKE